MKKLSIQEIKEKIRKINPYIELDESTYINTSTKCRFIDIKYGEFWCSPKYILNKKQKGHPKRAKEETIKTNLSKYGVSHPLKSKEIREKIKKTMMEKYGVEIPIKNSLIKKKTEETNKQKYGGKSPLSSPEIRNKIDKTNLEKYGTKSPLQNKEVKEKLKKTNLKKYGVACTLQHSEIKEKIKKTMMEKYGAENPFASEKIKEKIKKIMIENYGHFNPHQVPEIKEKINKKLAKRKPSSGEKEILEWLKSEGFDAKKRYIGKKGFKKEIDIVIKNKNVAIEYNGDYWHSTANKSITKRYHILKTEAARNDGIKLIHIFESEWKKRKDICKSFILSKLKKPQNIISARKCLFKEVSVSEANSFFERYHIKGKCKHFRSFGLFFENNLISCMAISKTKNKKENYISRFATAFDWLVIGGFSKLCNNSSALIGNLIAFIDLRLSDETMFYKSGFTFVKNIKPNFWFFNKKTKKTYSKKNAKLLIKKGKIIKEDLFKIWDCGKIKVEYKPKT